MVLPRFESTETVSQEEFALFAEEREGLGDIYHYELLNGRIVMNPPAGYPHGSIESTVHLLIGNFVRQRAIGFAFGSSQGFDLPSGDTVEPDTSYVSRERWDAAPKPVPGKFLRVVPDLIVEVLSPKNAASDRGEKKAIYERNGVREYWLIDWRTQELTVFLLALGRFDQGRCLDLEERFESTVLAGLAFAVSDLFDSP
ncbi:MAG: Uma2 family endonuclease [Myxococcales bacterium]|nr:Uma2 family endonuclease [Myxococcales bacterium]